MSQLDKKDVCAAHRSVQMYIDIYRNKSLKGHIFAVCHFLIIIFLLLLLKQTKQKNLLALALLSKQPQILRTD